MAHHFKPVPEWLNKNYVEEILASFFKEPDLKIRNLVIERGSKDGDNFLGEIFRLIVFINRNSKEEEMNIIAKLVPETKHYKDMNVETDMFTVESSFFSKLQELLLRENESIRQFTPICYHIDFEHKVIFMEDVKEKNYQMVTKYDFLPLQSALIVVEALATFHGASYRVLNKNPDFKEIFAYSLWRSKAAPVMLKWFRNNFIALQRNADSYGIPKEWCEKLCKLEERLKPNYMKVCERQEDRFNVILHGDPWVNNILFHFTKDNVVDKVMLLDYQMVYYNSFANDLHYFIFSSLKAQVIVDHLDEIIRKYYESLKKAAPEIPDISLERIESEFSERLFFGFILTVMFRPNFLSEHPPDIEKVVNGEVVDTGYKCHRFIRDLKILLPFFEKKGIF